MSFAFKYELQRIMKMHRAIAAEEIAESEEGPGTTSVSGKQVDLSHLRLKPGEKIQARFSISKSKHKKSKPTGSSDGKSCGVLAPPPQQVKKAKAKPNINPLESEFGDFQDEFGDFQDEFADFKDAGPTIWEEKAAGEEKAAEGEVVPLTGE